MACIFNGAGEGLGKKERDRGVDNLMHTMQVFGVLLVTRVLDFLA